MKQPDHFLRQFGGARGWFLGHRRCPPPPLTCYHHGGELLMLDKEPIEEIRQARLGWEAQLTPSGSATGADAAPARQHDPSLSGQALHTPAALPDHTLHYLPT